MAQTKHKEMDMLHGGLAGKLILFALPLAFSSILQQLFNSADVAVVGRFAGDTALAAVGRCVALVGIFVNLIVGLSVGPNAVLALLIGQNNREEINRTLHTVITFGAALGVGLMIVGWLTAKPILVLSGTPESVLDQALLRPGRFDRQVTVGYPDVKGREEILKVHARGKPIAPDVDLKTIAKSSAGFTGADLENLLNEAAIIAAKENRSFIANKDVKRAFVKVGIGAEKKSRIISDKEKKITAYHEAGHAILFHVLPDVGPVYTVSIIPTGVGAAGYTMPLPEKDEMFATKSRMLQDIMVSLGGRIAEEIIFGDITTGASSDIKKATKTARRMVTRYGMSDNIGVICYDDDDDEVFIGKDLAHAKAHSEEISGEIDKEVKHIIDDCYTKAKDIILQHEDVLHSCAQLLLEKEKITREEFEGLFV